MRIKFLPLSDNPINKVVFFVKKGMLFSDIKVGWVKEAGEYYCNVIFNYDTKIKLVSSNNLYIPTPFMELSEIKILLLNKSSFFCKCGRPKLYDTFTGEAECYICEKYFIL